MSGSGGELMQYWRDACKGAGAEYRPSSVETGVFMEMRGGPVDDAQIKWAISEYVRQTGYPSVQDFKSFLETLQTKDDLPDPVVAGAYLTGRPMLIRMADDLVTLQAAFFPTADTESRIESLRARLKGALS